MSNSCIKRLTINLANESIESLKQKGEKLKVARCPKEFKPYDPCAQRAQVIPAPVRRIKEKQIEVCRYPAVECICPPLKYPVCPTCPTLSQRLKSALKTGLKLAVLYAGVRWTINQQLWGDAEHTSDLTRYYKSIIYSLIYGETKGRELSFTTSPGFLDIRRAVYGIQMLWNKLVAFLFDVPLMLPRALGFMGPKDDYGDFDDY